MLNNKSDKNALLAGLLATAGLFKEPKEPTFPTVFEFKPNEYMRSLLAPNAYVPPKPLEETDPELAELIQWFEGQPKATRKKLDTVILPKKIGRNDPCPCGAMKDGKPVKFKKCCIDKA